MFDSGSVGANTANQQSAMVDFHDSGDAESEEQHEAATSPREVYFIDAAVPDVEMLICTLPATDEVVLLNSSEDGLVQMADYLNGLSELDVIHIVSHGKVGHVRAGAATLTQGNMVSYGTLLRSIGQSLASSGNILLHGCDLGSGDDKEDFVFELELLTGAGVAVSEKTLV